MVCKKGTYLIKGQKGTWGLSVHVPADQRLSSSKKVYKSSPYALYFKCFRAIQ